MAIRYYANAPATALENSCTALATSIEVSSVTGLPITYPYTLIIDRGTASEEAVSVTAAAGTTLTVTRGIDDTTAFAHAASAEVVHGITAQDIREANAHVNADAGVHGVVGDVVGTTDAQHLTNKTADTPATEDDTESLATTEFVKAVLLAANPVGSIAFNVTGANPSTYIGGTWEAWGSGRVPVGVDAGQTEFDTVEETGGAKTHTLTAEELPDHFHELPMADVAGASGFTDVPARAAVGESSSGTFRLHSAELASSATFGSALVDNGQPHNNLQPYITCYMFKRTA